MTMTRKLILAGAAVVLLAAGAFGGVLALSGEDEPERPVVEKNQPAPSGPEERPEPEPDPEEVADLYAPEGEVGVDQ
ncbi:hypothetical protein ACFVDI_07535 [Nocardioides sp. NPDC057767]|uniref:hypothetical protein n=1 Tax=unclassified Nocardioides TaxID=2615069 RepID=UPI00367021FF